MKYTAALLALATTALANPLPQGVTDPIEPDSSAPDGCMADASGTFNIQVVNVTSSSSKVKVGSSALLLYRVLTLFSVSKMASSP